MNISICIDTRSTGPDSVSKAVALSKSLCLPICESGAPATQCSLCYTKEGLTLSYADDTHPQQKSSSLRVDFLHGSVGYRHTHNLTIHQPLARATGIQPGFRPDILDATAGLGRDAFLLASLGCQVTLCERSKILWALLDDGLKRACQHEKTASIIQQHMRLIHSDATTFLANNPAQPPHTVYLDPMYPHVEKSALNKIEMRILRTLVGHDTDAANLLAASLAKATNRVVVKRPKGAPFLGNKQPHHSTPMKNSRFDVYLTRYL